MSKKFKTKNSKYKSALFGAVAVAASFAMFASACTPASDDGEEESNTSTRVDEQILKNGNFEFFNDNDGTYILGSADNWSSATDSGATSSDSASGVIGTTAAAWNRLTDPELPQKLWDNAALDSGDEDYVNYNASPEDLPFKDPASAIVENEDDDEDDDTDDYYIAEGAEYIANPDTHGYRWAEEDGKTVLYDYEGNSVEYYEKDGSYYTSPDFDEDSLIESNVLMIHNYVDDDKQGTATSFISSTTLTLETNTAAKISVWVKTSDLFFGGNNDTRTEVVDQRGAYIEIEQTAGGTDLDSFKIENINTAVLNPYDEESKTWANGNNGWVKYDIYVSACDYASTTLTVTLGLGAAENYTLEGYAFFDDVTFEKYMSVDEMIDAAGGSEAFDAAVNDPELGTTCDLLSEPEDKIFRVDNEIFNDGDTVVEHYSSKYSYHIDLAIASQTAVELNADNTVAGLTVDDSGYASSNGKVNYVGQVGSPEDRTTYLPTDLNLSTADDVIANLSVSDSESWTSGIDGNYQSILDDEIRTAATLPAAGGNANVLLMLSARGAAYESVIADPLFTVDAHGYKIVSFWIKTSELDDRTAVTVTARQAGDEDNASSFEIDTTTVDPTTINDVDDVYNGWVQCYALVSNSLDEEQQFELVINYGTNEIKGTTASDYYGGWAAVANLSTIDVTEKAFDYAESGSTAASLSITEASSTDTKLDDTLYPNQIQTSLAVPSTYVGVNGASGRVQSVPVEPSAYDKANQNEYAGLINKEYFETYKDTYSELLTSLDAGSPLKALFASDADWNKVVGSAANQPLLIINTVREVAENTSGIYNYGYIGSEASASADSYTAVSVKVKVSEGAVATVYLVDPDSRKELAYSTPAYTFWYDNDGNVLKGEPDEDATREEQRANIAYSLREDGLYEDAEGNLYANLFNYSREYYDERANYFDAEGTKVPFDSLIEGEIYYADATGSAYAPHYLTTTDGDRVYSYVSGTDGDVVYKYFVDGEVSDTQVKAFDVTVAVPRYTAEESSPYSFTIDAIANPELAEKWITVNFFIRTGSQAKDYRLELWSGTRDEQMTEGVVDGSYVMFDYSAVTLDESTYSSLLNHYQSDIADAYRQAIKAADADIVFASNDESIAYYEQIAKELGVSVDKYAYDAQYYTYTLYDSATYVPFNATTAEEGETGYNYAYNDYSEALAVLRVDDSAVNGSPMMNMFIDYSNVDKNISITTTTDVEDDEHDHDHGTTTDSTNIWLLVSSIVMVAAILIAIVVLLIRDMRKKFKRRPKTSKNTYNYTKNKRYVRTYVKEHGETPADNGELSEDDKFEQQLGENADNSPEGDDRN